MTVIIDDAGSGDLLFGVVVGAYREETQEFKYDLIDVKYFQTRLFHKKTYLHECSRITEQLLRSLHVKDEEKILLCQGYIFDEAEKDLKKTYGENRVQRIRVTGEAQRLTEIAYLDEIRNIGYEPIIERENKRAKSFFHMLRWVKENPERLIYAKTGWPRLSRYKISGKNQNVTYNTVCSNCKRGCTVPFKPKPENLSTAKHVGQQTA